MLRDEAQGSVLHLHPTMFTHEERPLLRHGDVELRTFRYASDVEAVRVLTPRIELVWLPFRGQQIWRFAVDGVDRTMRTTFDQPTRSTAFGETYGGFLLHCGLSGLGAPTHEDTHAHHGELPNLHYDEAYVVVEPAPEGPVIRLGGVGRIRRSHEVDVTFEPLLELDAVHATVALRTRITNHRGSAFDYAYLCHVNWAFPDSAQLVQTVPMDDEHVELAPAAGQDARTASYLAAIAKDLPSSNDLTQPPHLLPEYCAILRPSTQPDATARFMMIDGSGEAAVVRFPTEHFPQAIRWLSNTGDEAAAGFCLPTTACHLGRAEAARRGELRTVDSGASVEHSVELAWLSRAEAAAERALVDGTD